MLLVLNLHAHLLPFCCFSRPLFLLCYAVSLFSLSRFHIIYPGSFQLCAVTTIRSNNVFLFLFIFFYNTQFSITPCQSRQELILPYGYNILERASTYLGMAHRCYITPLVTNRNCERDTS